MNWGELWTCQCENETVFSTAGVPLVGLMLNSAPQFTEGIPVPD